MSSSSSVNGPLAARPSSTSAPAGTPWPGSGVTTMEPTSPKPSGISHAGADAGSIQREGTGGKPRSASARPGTSSGSTRSSVRSGVSPRRQTTVS